MEVERARLTHKLAMMKETEGDITEAATILQELQVETFGSMERKEKASYPHPPAADEAEFHMKSFLLYICSAPWVKIFYQIQFIVPYFLWKILALSFKWHVVCCLFYL